MLPGRPHGYGRAIAPFEVHEYAIAFTAFFGEAVQEVAKARSSLLAEIQVEEGPGPVASVIQDQQGQDVELQSDPIRSEYVMDRRDVRVGDISALLMQVDLLSADLSHELERRLFTTMEKVTGATGNVIEAKGMPTWDAIIAMLETVELGLDDEGKLSLPTVYMHPKSAEKLKQPTSEQASRLDELLAKRQEELLARRRSRRLS